MDFFKSMKEKVSDGVDTIGTAVDNATDKVKDALPKEFVEKMESIKKEMEDWKNEKIRLLKEWEEEKRQQFRMFIQSKLEKLFDHSMNIAGEHLKERLKDPYMPDCVQNLVDGLVDSVWPDVKIEVKDVILSGVAPQMVIDHGEKPGCCCAIYGWMRYQVLPYDRGFWRQIRNPFWWLFTLACVFPKYGVSQITYMLMLFLIDKSDEFQLQEYILQFKALQFISLGVLSAMIGAAQYYICLSEDPPNCDEYAPREMVWTILLFVLQIFFVWSAFAMLGSSKKKGGFFYQHTQEETERIKAINANRSARLGALNNITDADTSTASAGREDVTQLMLLANEEELLNRSKGRLVGFLIYDAVCFVICILLVCWVAFWNVFDADAQVDFSDGSSWNYWKFQMSVFWIKALYGMMSFPFIVLKLPLLSSFICHAKPTGYNPYGTCVPYLGVEEGGPLPWDPERPPKKDD